MFTLLFPKCNLIDNTEEFDSIIYANPEKQQRNKVQVQLVSLNTNGLKFDGKLAFIPKSIRITSRATPLAYWRNCDDSLNIFRFH